MNKKNSLTARILAALALVATVVAILVVVSSETGSDTGEPARNPAGAKERNGGGAGNDRKPAQAGQKKVYEVQEGDTLSGIAAENGVSVERIEELNPDLDPQALIPGQELNIR
jgi:LysM repeat protein